MGVFLFIDRPASVCGWVNFPILWPHTPVQTKMKCPPPGLKARSHDPFLRIQFLVPKTGSRRSDGPISRFRFCGENVGRSFVVCSHDPFFRTNKESSVWRQNDHAEFVGAFHLSRRVSDENRACSISIRFFKIKDPFDGRSFFMCSHDPFYGTNNRILKNGSYEQALSHTKINPWHC